MGIHSFTENNQGSFIVHIVPERLSDLSGFNPRRKIVPCMQYAGKERCWAVGG
jgi:hypothetical protein